MLPHDPDPRSAWVLLGRSLILVAAVLCQLAITSTLLRRARRPSATFHIMLVHWLLWGPVLAFGWSLQFISFASPALRIGVASFVIWAVVGGLSLICLGLGLGLSPGAAIAGMPLLHVCVHPPEQVSFRSVRGRSFWAIASLSLGLGLLVYAAVFALSSTR